MPLHYNEKGTVHVDAASCAEDRDNRVALLRSEHLTTSSSFALIQSATPGASLANAGTTELSLSGHCQADPAVPTARGGPSPDTHTAMNFMNLVPFVSDHGDPCIIRARCSLLNRKSDDVGRGVTGLEVTNMIGICSYPHTQIYIYMYLFIFIAQKYHQKGSTSACVLRGWIKKKHVHNIQYVRSCKNANMRDV